MTGRYGPDAAVAFDDFYRATARRTLQYAYGVTGDLGHAQDLTQEAYIRAWQRWPTVQEYDHAEAWLRLVVTRMATDRWRRLAVHRRFASRVAPPPPMEPPSEDAVLLTAALRRLPVPQRQALTMHYLLDMAVSQIAAETGAAEGTVKSWLARGRTALAELLSERRTEEHHHA